jgi:dTDP-4-amino-4,6-dideoxygalactose transaminase
MVANHGQSKRYYHDMVGCNSRLDTIQAAILRIKLRKLDQYIDSRRKAAEFYDAFFGKLPHIHIPMRSKNTKHVFHQYTLQLDDQIDRDGLVEYLASKDIPAMIYYPVPAHKQKMFAQLETECGDLTNTDWLTSRVFSLPMHTELDDEQLNFICDAVKSYIEL